MLKPHVSQTSARGLGLCLNLRKSEQAWDKRASLGKTSRDNRGHWRWNRKSSQEVSNCEGFVMHYLHALIDIRGQQRDFPIIFGLLWDRIVIPSLLADKIGRRHCIRRYIRHPYSRRSDQISILFSVCNQLNRPFKCSGQVVACERSLWHIFLWLGVTWPL